MKTLILYTSTHHGNTRKLLDAIAREEGVELVDLEKDPLPDMNDYDRVGLASGIYFGRFSKAVRDMAKMVPADKDVFLICTSGSGSKKNFDELIHILEKQNANVVGTYQALGFDTFGPFALIGGIKKGHPDKREILNARYFYHHLPAPSEFSRVNSAKRFRFGLSRNPEAKPAA